MLGRRKKKHENVMRAIAIAKAAEKRVQQLPKKRLLEIYSDICDGKWVEDLGAKPDDWDAMTAYDQHFILRDSVRYIETRICRKERERFQRMMVFGDSPEEFNEWWESQFLEALQKIASRI